MLGVPMKKPEAAEFINVVELDKEDYDESWQMYSDRTDKEWSLTDCISFTVMKRNGIRDAFTNDHHFEQAGFNVLIKHR